MPIFLLAIPGPAGRDTGHLDVAARIQPGTTPARPVPSALARPVPHPPPELRYLPRCPLTLRGRVFLPRYTEADVDVQIHSIAAIPARLPAV